MDTSNRVSSRPHLCVYCGSGTGKDPAYLAAARQLGQEIARAGLGLVYGGGTIGLMGELAKTVISENGPVTGVIPKFLMKRERMLEGDGHELIIVDDMHDRKMTMFNRAHGFVALPGGIGTLEELVEMATWAQLAQHNKPIIVANINNYWQPLLDLLKHMREEAFIREGLEVHFEVVSKAEDIVPAFLSHVPAPGKAVEKRTIIEKL
jgi:uncharacterized protein (TIGR00730 family)